MIYIIAYLLMGVVFTALLLEFQEGETVREVVTDTIISIIGWPYILFMVIKDMFREEDDL